jgi:hypothetical protein
MESTPMGNVVAAGFPIREGMALSTPCLHPFGAFPKRALWLMLSFADRFIQTGAKLDLQVAVRKEIRN